MDISLGDTVLEARSPSLNCLDYIQRSLFSVFIHDILGDLLINIDDDEVSSHDFDITLTLSSKNILFDLSMYLKSIPDELLEVQINPVIWLRNKFREIKLQILKEDTSILANIPTFNELNKHVNKMRYFVNLIEYIKNLLLNLAVFPLYMNSQNACLILAHISKQEGVLSLEADPKISPVPALMYFENILKSQELFSKERGFKLIIKTPRDTFALSKLFKVLVNIDQNYFHAFINRLGGCIGAKPESCVENLLKGLLGHVGKNIQTKYVNLKDVISEIYSLNLIPVMKEVLSSLLRDLNFLLNNRNIRVGQIHQYLSLGGIFILPYLSLISMLGMLALPHVVIKPRNIYGEPIHDIDILMMVPYINGIIPNNSFMNIEYTPLWIFTEVTREPVQRKIGSFCNKIEEFIELLSGEIEKASSSTEEQKEFHDYIAFVILSKIDDHMVNLKLEGSLIEILPSTLYVYYKQIKDKNIPIILADISSAFDIELFKLIINLSINMKIRAVDLCNMYAPIPTI